MLAYQSSSLIPKQPSDAGIAVLRDSAEGFGLGTCEPDSYLNGQFHRLSELILTDNQIPPLVSSVKRRRCCPIIR